MPDASDTRVTDRVEEFASYGAEVRVHDPLLGPEGLWRLGLRPTAEDPFTGAGAPWDLVVLAVPHRQFGERGPASLLALLPKGEPRGVFADVKGAFPAEPFVREGVARWSL